MEAPLTFSKVGDHSSQEIRLGSPFFSTDATSAKTNAVAQPNFKLLNTLLFGVAAVFAFKANPLFFLVGIPTGFIFHTLGMGMEAGLKAKNEMDEAKIKDNQYSIKFINLFNQKLKELSKERESLSLGDVVCESLLSFGANYPSRYSTNFAWSAGSILGGIIARKLIGRSHSMQNEAIRLPLYLVSNYAST